jgi:aarF domain-containing kinase
MDIAVMEKIAKEWGIRDIQMFASATIQRPWKPGRAVHVGRGYSMEDLYEMQTEAKDRVKHFLSDTKKVPEELVFIGRNLNLIRSNNKALDAPVNRITIMADIAAKNADFGFRKWTFHLTLWFMTMHFYLSQWVTRIRHLFGLKANNYEEVLDRKVEKLMLEKYGIRVDMNAFSG